MTNVSVRYIVEVVAASIEFYVTHFGFTLEQDARPAFASVIRESLRLLLSGQGSSGARAQCPTAGPWRLEPDPAYD
jgi:catechol 2,3-dioxygenase-like lactoylglutathione lyase family enzyme